MVGLRSATRRTAPAIVELTASGRTNREVAAALRISPKTVEAKLARIYQKFEIRSRAELGRRMADLRPIYAETGRAALTS